MKAANKQLLQQVYAEISRGNVQPLLDSLADDVEWTIIGSTALSGTSRGKQEVIDKPLKPLRARLADGPVVFEPERFIAEGEYVVMQAQGRATARSGKPYNNTYCIVCRIVDGKVKQMIDYVDTELITSALGA
ncbi:MAG: nuclear transport factor 2 family protein [Reyranella sp.]|nr:nuclear transport factor 2 family protein [Reyranella sp.]MBL6653598.1 nuclear transport factor 2 family protein [Reyranella sp.]